MIGKYIIGLSVTTFSFCSFGQSNKINPTTQLWSECDLSGYLAKKWKWQVDLQYSRQSPYEDIDMFKYGSQLTIRPWIHYYIKKNVRLSAFAGIWYNYYIQEVGAREYPEYRTAIQANFYTNKSKSILTKRVRLELRDMQDREGIFEQVLRLRTMMKYQHLILHNSFDKGSAYFFCFDEFFLNSGSNVTGYHTFDQNRLFIGVGYNLTNDVTFETGYFNQLQQHAHDDNYDMNHIWQVTLMIDNL